MRILIVGTHRSGTTSLLLGLAEQGYKKISEPFNRYFISKKEPSYETDLSLSDRVCFKTIISQIPYDTSLDPVEFYLQFSKQFDRVVLLDRLEFNEHWISYCNMFLKSIKNKPRVLHQTWYSEEITPELEASYIKAGHLSELKREKNLLNELSNKLNIKVTYYENLYSKDLLKVHQEIERMNIKVDISKLSKFLDPNKKYKKSKLNQPLI